MWHVGVDQHRETVVIAGVTEEGRVFNGATIRTSEPDKIVETMKALVPFRAVIEASWTYRWLYKLLAPLGTVLLAHPFRLRAMVLRRSKTDKLDAMLLAQLLRINQVPLSYIPEDRYQELRDLTRYRVGLGRDVAQVKGAIRAMLARENLRAPFRLPYGRQGLRWLEELPWSGTLKMRRDDLIGRLRELRRRIREVEKGFEGLPAQYPEVESLLDIHGIGLYTALLIVAELGDVGRFREGRQVGAYTGLTARVNQSGGHCDHGHITKQGSSWLRWAMVEAGMKAIRRDERLENFYTRIRKRASAKIARVAVARKLAEICWKRLRRWHREHPAAAA